MSALKVRKQSPEKQELIVIKKDASSEHFFSVDKDDSILYLGSDRDGFQDNKNLGEVIDPGSLSIEVQEKIKRWFNRS